MTGAEEWRPIPGWSHYEESTHGRVRSLPHTDSRGRRWPGKVLRTVTAYEPTRTRRRRQVSLCDGCRRATYYIDDRRFCVAQQHD